MALTGIMFFFISGGKKFQIKVSAELYSFLEALWENLFAWLFQLLGATYMPWLAGHFLHLQNQPSCVSPTLLLQQCFSLILLYVPHPLIRTLEITWGALRKSSIISLY